MTQYIKKEVRFPELELIEDGHFDPYVRQFGKAGTPALKWFQRFLLVVIFTVLYMGNAQSSPIMNNLKTLNRQENKKADTLHYKVFTVTRSRLTLDPQMPGVNDSLKWVANSSTLIYGKEDAVLVDVFLTIDQANALADSIAAIGKNLKYIYITHSHGDHFFGLKILLDRFPTAVAVSTQAIADDCADLIKPEIVNKFWRARFPGQIPQQLTAPQAMQADEIDLEENKLVVIQTGFTDTHHSTSLYVPSIGLLVAGDVVYNGIHPYLTETSSQTRKEWIAALDKLAALHPKIVIAGHKNPANGDSQDNIAATKKYLEDFERLNGETSTALELFNKMLTLYPDRANPGRLWEAAGAAKK
jgi:glyoxylase-like metal-dependent hydrolase (beta-lactamase superfamily II)